MEEHTCNGTNTTLTETPGALRRGIEVEYWVVDRDGRLVDAGPLVDGSDGIDREFIEPVLEIKTSPCDSTGQSRDELCDRIEGALDRAEATDRRLVPLATPLCPAEIRDVPSDRTRIQERIIGDSFEYIRHCAGTHIHIQQLPRRAIDQFNTLTALDPALALINSSPYFDGSPLSSGARSQLYRSMAYADMPNQGNLWPYCTSLDDWERRLQSGYAAFEEAAKGAGISRERFEASFDPETSLWTPVQIRSPFDTVEWRSPDAALPSQVIKLADDVTSILEHLENTEVRIEGTEGRVTADTIVLPEFDALMEYVQAAIRDGLRAPQVRKYLERMGFDVSSYRPITHEIAGRDEISTDEARQLRLEYADRLEEDVRT
ncbi:glutamate-cysteine ligase family protein [Halorubrum sp. DTA98]|uniref:glutamate-cysteine ligase family protein n=1 Tax=Halorubrum sp. DTA98 TaxID=3402163 RepID=UPI003AAD4785